MSLSLRMERVSYPALILFALTDHLCLLRLDHVTDAGLVQYDPMASTTFRGRWSASLATVILLLIGLQASGRLTTDGDHGALP